MQCLPCDRLTTHHPATLNYYHYKLFCIYLCNGMYAIANCWRGEKNPGGHQTFVLRGSVGDDLHDEGNWSANECIRTGTWYRKHDDGDQSKRQLIYTCKKNNNLYMCHWWLLFHTVVYSEISKCVKMTSGFLKFTLNFKKLLIITVLLPQHWRYLTNWICDF